MFKMSIVKEKIRNLPNHPGCYLFKNRADEIIYIGKAKDLKKRVSSYFNKNIVDPKTKQLVSKIKNLDYIVTDSEVEALLLEARLIKDQQPQYNLELKGGVRYAYIKVTNELFPRLETVRIFKNKDEVYGPYVWGTARRNLIRLANTLFKLRVGKTKPQAVAGKYKIKCSVPPWTRIISLEEYKKDLDRARMLLQGKVEKLIVDLKKEMDQFSSQEKYELAKLRRDQIKALVNLQSEQKIHLKKNYDQDVINGIITANKFIVQLFNINKGVVSGRKQFSFAISIKQDLPELLAGFVKQYYYSHELPQEVVAPVELPEKTTIESYLTRLAGRKVRIKMAKRGTNLQLLELVKKNILVSLKRGDSALFELQESLSLPKLPTVIECFDVSNLGDSFIVGSMVCFKDGLPDKNNYRRFKIKWQTGQSDFDAMREIIYRRYYRLKIDKADLPDLILIDGGKPQMSAGLAALRSLGLTIPIAALAKKQEEIYRPGNSESIKLDRKSDALKLVQKIRDEAHRFAITYNRLLRRKSF
ncbi:MAG: excinuclease ABC subunit UvrC [Candidatus Buchananbacteria bacterium]|nr:excinuclease ABC subunit UvrC [Candidatus Buchananbacteria bacterium]